MTSLDAAELHAAAGTLDRAAVTLREDVAARHHSWGVLPVSGFRGAAAQAAVDRLHELTTPLGLPAEQMAAVARVLAISALLQEQLDRATARVIAAADLIAGVSPFVDVALRELASLGEALDWMCARQVDRLCTPVPAAPPQRLADLPDLPIDAVHDLMLLHADPEIVALARQHPDLRVLEVAEGGLVGVIGELEAAGAVITVVAGVGSADQTGWSSQIDRVRTITATTGGAGVVWLGYPAPGTVPGALARDPARQAGEELARFQAELARRQPAQRRIVLSHSYGSVVAGAAAHPDGPGLHADDLVILGSPGVGVARADQLQLHGQQPRVHTMLNGGDPIGLLVSPRAGVHGVDPAAAAFGAQVWTGDPHGDHSSYWEDPALLSRLGELAAQKKPAGDSL